MRTIIFTQCIDSNANLFWVEADRQGWSVSTSPGCDSKQRSTLQLIQCPIRIPARIQAWNAAVGQLLAHRSSCWLSCSW